MKREDLLNGLVAMANERDNLANLAGEMLATLELNMGRGTLTTGTADGNDTLRRLMAKWKEQYRQNVGRDE